MDYIIFGAGVYGKCAMEYLGRERCSYFADNYHYGIQIDGIEVLSFEEMLSLQGEYIYVIAMEKHFEEVEEQFLSNGVRRYFIYDLDTPREILRYYPFYRVNGRTEHMPHMISLACYEIYKYHNIYIYGSNEYLPYLISEITFQNEWNSIKGIVSNKTLNTMGIPIVSREEAFKNADCLVICVRREESDIREILDETDYTFQVVDLFHTDQFLPIYQHPELARFKDIHKGKRCFIIGNGPSLTIEDLEMLHRNQEICFGSNMICRVYSKTNWRPTYYAMIDWLAIKNCLSIAAKETGTEVFVSDLQFHRPVKHMLSNVHLLHMPEDVPLYEGYPGFSDDITKCVYHGGSVSYGISMQVAAYMGFTEIYLLGTDNNYVKASYVDGNHFIDNYYDSEEKKELARKDTTAEVARDYIARSFIKAEKYSRRHEFRIYNATRGGMLEVFERVEFDSLFSEEDLHV